MDVTSFTHPVRAFLRGLTSSAEAAAAIPTLPASQQLKTKTCDLGTTGKPKGVDVTHRNVANLVCMSPGNLGIRPGHRVGQVLNISFDMGMLPFPEMNSRTPAPVIDVGLDFTLLIFECQLLGKSLHACVTVAPLSSGVPSGNPLLSW